MKTKCIPSPCYVIDEEKLRNNLTLIQKVAKEADVEIILALKAFAMWKSFPIFRKMGILHTTASSPYEAQLTKETFGSLTYTYSPAYESSTFEQIMDCSEHITFNSLSQYLRFSPQVQEWNSSHPTHVISCGLRVNPEYSEIETDLYNPCAPGTRFGVKSIDLDEIPEGIEGLHFHCLCENDSAVLVKVLNNVEKLFGKHLGKIKWINMGGGHLMTRKGYNIDLLVETLKRFHHTYPHLKLIMEPGSAFLWQTGWLESEVVDIVENDAIKTAILNVSFTCHMPDCLEMPYHPTVRNAEIIEEPTQEEIRNPFVYRLGGNSCLSGDFMGYWKFTAPLQIGQKVIFEDMIHYTTVKTNMFNGISHPAIAIKHLDGQIEVLRQFDYSDYKSRMN